jgi:hypothetical protein
MKSMALVYGSLIGLEFFLGRSDGLRGTWEGNNGGNGFSVVLFNDRSSDAVLLSLSSRGLRFTQSFYLSHVPHFCDVQFAN